MKITVIGRKCTPRDSFKERAEKRLRKVEKFFPDEVEAKVTAIVEKSEQIVEVTIFHDGMIFRSQERAINMNDALDRCVDSLVRQIRKNKTRLEKRLRDGAFDRSVGESEVLSSEPEEEPEQFEIIRTKRFSIKPMTAEEAILQMNLLEHEFFAFKNMDEDDVFSVVYRRKNGGYGLICATDVDT